MIDSKKYPRRSVQNILLTSSSGFTLDELIKEAENREIDPSNINVDPYLEYMDCYGDDQSSPSVRVYYNRLENDEEYLKRLKRIETDLEKAEREDIETYERLKKKFGV